MSEPPGHEANEEKTHRHFLLAFVLSVLALVVTQAYLIESPPPAQHAAQLTGVGLALLATLIWLAPTTPMLWLGQLLIFQLFIHFAYITWHTAGVHSTALDWIMIIPSCTLLFKSRMTWFWSAATVILLVTLGVSQLLFGMPSPVPGAQYAAWCALNTMGITITIIGHLIFNDHVNDQHMKQLLAQKEHLEQVQQQLIRTQAHKDEFIAVVSHEIRTPMNAVLGFATLIRDQLQIQTQTITNHIQTSSHQLLDIISDILDFSQLQANKVELYPTWINLKHLLTQARDRALDKLKNKPLVIDIVIERLAPHAIYVDEYRISQVLDQLIDNAIKFTDQGRIELKLRRDSNFVWIDVKDQGIGLEREEFERIFAGFQHANTQVQRRYGGTGLGLAICKHIIKLHHGQIQATQSNAQGAVFSVALPINDNPSIHHEHTEQTEENRQHPTTWRARVSQFVIVNLLDDFQDRSKVFMVLLVSIGVNLYYYHLIAPFPQAEFTEAVLSSCDLLGAWLLYRKVNMQTVLNFALLTSFIGIVYLCIYSGGVFSPVMSWLNMVVIAALYLGNKPAKIGWTLAAFALQITLAIGTYFEIWPSDTATASYDARWSLSGHFSLLALLTVVPLAYKLVRENTQNELLQSNLRLTKVGQDLLHQQFLKDQFISTVSHALRTPLNTIIGFCDLLRDDIQSRTELLELQGMMAQSARHLLTVINDILDHSQLTSGQLKLKIEPFELPQTIRNAFQMFKAASQNAQVDLQLDLRDLPQWVLGDAQRLTQILVNLLNNAIKFTHEGYIRIKVYPIENDIRFEVQDTGSGIPNDKMNHIFDQYEQVDIASHRKKGHGLGLSITKRLIQAQEGWIQVHSQVLRGTTFTFQIHFPLTQAPLSTQAHIPTISQPATHLRILIVDDQPLNRLLARQVLQRAWDDIVLTEATNGLQAIEQLQSAPVDLILMDVLMPEMDGIAATQHIRTQLEPALRGTPILGLTANAYEVTRVQCLEAGMNDIIYKPFNREQLIHTIQQLTWPTHSHALGA